MAGLFFFLVDEQWSTISASSHTNPPTMGTLVELPVVLQTFLLRFKQANTPPISMHINSASEKHETAPTTSTDEGDLPSAPRLSLGTDRE